MTATMSPTTTTAGLRDELELDFARAARELAEARSRQAAKDTPAARADVVACAALVDAVLDMYLAAGGPR